MKKFYITTTLPYVNSDPHIGFALEAIQADSLARYWRLMGNEVFFNTGVDEHGQKIYEAAEKAGQSVEEYTNHYASEFQKLKEALNLSNDTFIRTTNPEHYKAAQEMWRLCDKAGDIYKKEYEGLYCVGCEKFLTEKEIIDGVCHIHKKEPQKLKEENYFFRFSKYQDQLLKYLSNESSVTPDWRREEAINFVKEGLEDFSISREKERLSWGVPVPGDDTQVMYVWFDALTNYISTLGWPEDKEGNFNKFWKEGITYQMAGKDQVRFQSLMFQAMLMSAGIKNTDHVFYHGFINSDGQKMSKSLGNVISPYDLVKKYGTDATRYMMLRHVHPVEDSDVTWERLDEWYTANLVNGLGNLVARVMKLAQDYLKEPVNAESNGYLFKDYLEEKIGEFKFDSAIEYVWQQIGELDEKIQQQKPWESKDTEVIKNLVLDVYRIGSMVSPFMPDTSEKILEAIKENKKPENLFPRLES